MSQSTQPIQLDAVLVNAVSSATSEVLQTMAQTEAKLKGVKASPGYVPSGDISAIIGITGNSGEGMISLSFSMTLASIIVGRLLGLTPSQVTSDDRADAIGELANMISGKAKISLSEGGTPYRLSLPTVILGPAHEISSRPKGTPYLILTFEADGETFNLQVSFKHQ